MRYKKGVDLSLREEITRIFPVIDLIYTKYGQDCVITCGFDGLHSKYSRHYLKIAIDVRTRYFTRSVAIKVAREIRAALKKLYGNNYNVLTHKTHIHIAYKPTR